MKNKTIMFPFPLCIIFMFIALGCSNIEGNRRFFLLEASRDKIEPNHNDSGVLLVGDFQVLPPFGGKGLIYRTGELEYKSDYYNELMTWPEELVKAGTYKWLSDSGIFSSVSCSNGLIDTDYILNGTVTALYGDYIAESPYKSVTHIKFVLLQVDSDGKPEIILDKTYSTSVKFSSKETDALIKAYNEGLTVIFQELEKDIRNVMSNLTPKELEPVRHLKLG